jgi:hypothetical protein
MFTFACQLPGGQLKAQGRQGLYGSFSQKLNKTLIVGKVKISGYVLHFGAKQLNPKLAQIVTDSNIMFPVWYGELLGSPKIWQFFTRK